MNDDGEFPASHPSPDTVEAVDDGNDEQDTGSPRSASLEPANGRLITLALPIQTRRSTPPSSVTAAAAVGGGGGGGREDCWTEEATAVLIEAWGERYAEQSRGILKQKQWEEVAEIVSARAGARAGKPARTDVQCKNRVDTVKRKYKSEKAKIAAGAGPSNWIFFDRLDRLLGIGNPNSTASAAKISHAAASKNQAASSISQQSHAFLRRNNGRMKRPVSLTVDSDSDSDDLSPESSDSLPPGANLYQQSSKRQKAEFNFPPLRPPKFAGVGAGAASMRGQGRVSEWNNSVRELARVIAVFSEAYEQAESEKLQQMVEMEKQRMKFAKELELQRMKFLMKTQLQLSRLGGRLGGGGSGGGENNHRQGRHHNSHVNDGNNVNNNSGCSN